MPYDVGMIVFSKISKISSNYPFKAVSNDYVTRSTVVILKVVSFWMALIFSRFVQFFQIYFGCLDVFLGGFCSTFRYPDCVPPIMLNINTSSRRCQAIFISAVFLVWTCKTPWPRPPCFPLIKRPTVVCVLLEHWVRSWVSLLISETNRLPPLSEEGMLLRVSLLRNTRASRWISHMASVHCNLQLLQLERTSCYLAEHPLLARHSDEVTLWGNQQCFLLRAQLSKRKCRLFSSGSALLTRSLAFLCDLQAEVIRSRADYWLAASFRSLCGCKRMAAGLSFAPVCTGWQWDTTCC